MVKPPADGGCAAGEKSLYDRIGVGQVQSQVAYSPDHRVVRDEQSEKAMGGPAQREYVLGARALEPAQQHPVPGIGRLAQQIRQAVCIAQAEVDSLPGE